MNLLTKPICLKLNRHWNPIHIDTPKSIFVDLAKETITAVEFVYPLINGKPDKEVMPEMILHKWDEWINLPVRDWDLSVATAHSRVRIPVVVICCHYDKIPHKTLKLTKSNIVFRDARIDQYTGKEIKGKHDCSIDHVVPLSRGGKSTWENMVLTTKENNLIKGDKLPHEVGFKLIRKPLKPRPVPISIILDKQPFKEWELFLIK